MRPSPTPIACWFWARAARSRSWAPPASSRRATLAPCTEARSERIPGNARQGPSRRAAHARVGAGDDTVLSDHVHCLSVWARPPEPRGKPRRRRAARDHPLCRDPRDQPPLPCRARRGRFRRFQALAGRPDGAFRRQGRGDRRLPGGPRADRGPRLRGVLSRWDIRARAAGRNPGPRRPRAGRDGRPDLLDGRELPCAGRARPAAPPAADHSAGRRGGEGFGARIGCRRAFIRRLRQVAGRARSLRYDVRGDRLRRLRIRHRGLIPAPVEARLRMKAPSLRTLSIIAVAAVAVAYSLVFFYAPNDADQGFIQKIFYLHVPLAICALAGFIVGAYHAIQHLRTGDAKHDARSYVSIHMSVIFGVAVLITGSIWARASWGKWWVWQEPTPVSFLIVFLLYATYYPLRYAIADRERQGRYASVFAITAGAFVPLNFMAVRLAQPLVHPRVFATANGGLTPKMTLTFLVCLGAMAMLWVTLVRFELAAKATRGKVSRLRRALEGDLVSPVAGSRIAPPVPADAAGS